MSPEDAVVIVAAGLGAGATNTVAGGGSLLSFPALLAVGYPALTANVSNTAGLLPGYAGGTLAYRPELRGQGARARALTATMAAGSVVGCVVLLSTPERVFRDV